MRGCPVIWKLLRDDRGATAIEYGLILALIALGMIGAMYGVGGESNEMWTHVENEVLEVSGQAVPPPD